MIGLLVFGLAISCAQSQWQPHTQWNAQPAQPQVYSVQNSKALHHQRLNDPHWALTNPIKPWEAAYNGPVAAQPAPQPTWYAQPAPQAHNPVISNQYSYQPKAAAPAPAPGFTQPQILPGQRPGNVLWAVQAKDEDPLWAIKAKQVNPAVLWALTPAQRAIYV